MVWLVASTETGGFKLLLVLGMIVCKPFFKHFFGLALVVELAPLSRWGKACGGRAVRRCAVTPRRRGHRRVKWFGTNMYTRQQAANCAYVCLSRDSGMALIASMFGLHEAVKPANNKLKNCLTSCFYKEKLYCKFSLCTKSSSFSATERG